LTVESTQAHETKEREAREAKEHQEARERREAQETKERQEAKEREEQLLAAKKHQEEEARVTTLGFKEGSPDATIADRSLLASLAGEVKVEVVCPRAVDICEGTVTVRTLDAVFALSAGGPNGRAVVQTLASAPFTVAGGASKEVILRLSSKARALLARLHSVRVRVIVVAHDPAGGTHTGQAIITLRMASARHVRR
jgi:hypothetical protein